MKKEAQTSAQPPVLDVDRELQIKKTKKRSLLFVGAVICVSSFVAGYWILGAIGSVCMILVSLLWRSSPGATQVIDVQSKSTEPQLKSRLNKLKFGEHPALGERAASLYDRYLVVFAQAEKILYAKLSPQEITAQRFQKVFDEMKENLHTTFATMAQTLEISSKTSLDPTVILEQLHSIEKDLMEVMQSMDSLQKTQLGMSNSTFDQSFLVEEMKKLTARIQKMD